jgi:hypothetical protein
MLRIAWIARLAACALALAMVPAIGVHADEIGGEGFSVPGPQPVTAPPPAYVELQTRHVAAGIGFHRGAGTLSFEGRQHAFRVTGVSLLDVGAARLIGEGEVENLERLSDFAGTYVAVEAAAAAGKGVSRRVLRNEHGVVIRLASDLTGVGLSLGAQGFQVALE